jgi:hypothetical protein
MLKFNLVKLHKEIIFQILEQDDDITHKVGPGHTTASIGIAIAYRGEKYFIKSISNIDLYHLSPKNTIYIRGNDKSMDFSKSSITFNSNKERDIAFETILYVLKKAAENKHLFKHLNVGDDFNYI